MSPLFEQYEILARSGLFDPAYYAANNPEIVATNADPLLHYIEHGARAGRDPCEDFDSVFYLEQCSRLGEQPENPLLHFLTRGAAQGLTPKRGAMPSGRWMRNGHAAAADAEHSLPVALTVDRISTKHDPRPSLVIQGWAIAATPLVEIAATIGGLAAGYAAYGLDRPDVAQRYPHYPNAAQSGFALTIDQIPAEVRGETVLTLLARTADGETHEQSFTVHVERSERNAAEAPAQEQPPATPNRPPMRLQVDSISLDERGVLGIEGWVTCLVQVESVEVYVDDVRLGTAAYGLVRDDVADAYATYPNARYSGFSIVADVNGFGGAKRTVRIQALSRTGISREVRVPVDLTGLPRNSAPIDADTFAFHCDEIELTTSGRLALSGWAVCALPVTAIDVLFDGLPVGRAELGIERPDVGNIHPTLPHARRSGFTHHARVDAPVDGEHLVTLRLHTAKGEEREVAVRVTAATVDETTDIGGVQQPADAEGLKFYLDLPRLVGGMAEAPVRSSLAISGWALARAGVERLDVAIDGKRVAAAHYGSVRRDVAAACPDWEGALYSGFNALIPPKALPSGRHTVTLTIFDKRDRHATIEFSIDVEPVASEGPWSLRRKMPASQSDLYNRILAGMAWRPHFRVLIRVGRGGESCDLACASLASLRDQPYAEWRAVIAPNDADIDMGNLRSRILADFDDIAGKVEFIAKTERRLLADIAVDRKDRVPTLFAALCAGDEVSCDALFEFAIASGLNREAEFLYGDDRRVNPATGAVDAFFKPDWSPDLLSSCDYIGRAWCATPALLRRTGATVKDLVAHGSYDLVLRCTEMAQGIRRIPAVLHQQSTLPLDSGTTGQRALARALKRRKIAGRIVAGCAPGYYRLQRTARARGRVSIIIPTCASRGLIRPCIETLRRVTAYRNFEIICIENIPKQDRASKKWLRANADAVIEAQEPFNWSRFNNVAAAKATGEFLLFLNDDIEIIDPAWLDAMLEHAQRPEVGAVGPLLLYPDRRIQHAGMFLMSTGQARHAFRFGQEDDPGYFGLALSQRNVIAVTGACLLTRRDTFDALHGFDEAHSVINNDLDYCLRAWRRGLVNVYTPHAKLIHHEFASRASIDEKFDTKAFSGSWQGTFAHGDPYHHPSLSRDDDDFVPEREPLQIISAGHPLMARDAVRRILVVKLDHIGDCVTALPAVRRLKRHFPQARLSVLAARATRMIWAHEPEIDEILEFDYFHSRSGLGKREVSEEELMRLRRSLGSRHFDLAVDLRKNPDARHVLQYTGARYLAAFDYEGRFPFLDIALEWEGDRAYGAKRQHVGDDLAALVETIAAACDPDRAVLPRPTGGVPKSLGAEVGKLFRRKVVCIHPAVGTVMRQWPPGHFAELIDLLAAEARVNIALIGGPDEADIAKSVLAHVRNAKSVWNLVGRFHLNELPGFLSACALFVGNNSGPKHIAAAIGVPTIGLHSGVVDAREWGPMGPMAIALRRDMACSPCYLEKREDCSRGLACLHGLRPGDVYRHCLPFLVAGAKGLQAL